MAKAEVKSASIDAPVKKHEERIVAGHRIDERKEQGWKVAAVQPKKKAPSDTDVLMERWV